MFVEWVVELLVVVVECVVELLVVVVERVVELLVVVVKQNGVIVLTFSYNEKKNF